MLFACCGCIVAAVFYWQRLALLYKLLYCGWQTDLTLLRHGVVFTTVFNRLHTAVHSRSRKRIIWLLYSIYPKLHPFRASFYTVWCSPLIRYIATYRTICGAMWTGRQSKTITSLTHSGFLFKYWEDLVLTFGHSPKQRYVWPYLTPTTTITTITLMYPVFLVSRWWDGEQGGNPQMMNEATSHNLDLFSFW